MARYEVRFVHPARRMADRDGYAVGLRVLRDGEYFQFVQVVATGEELELAHPKLAQRSIFWAAATVCGARRVPLLIESGDLPRRDPTVAVDVRLDYDNVSDVMEHPGGLPWMEENELVLGFELWLTPN